MRAHARLCRGMATRAARRPRRRQIAPSADAPGAESAREAFERLRSALEQIDAVSTAALAYRELLCGGADREQRCDLERLDALLTLASRLAEDAVAEAAEDAAALDAPPR